MSGNSSDLESKLMSVLSNPEALSGIMSLAKNFTQSNLGKTNDSDMPTIAAEAEAVQASAPIGAPGFSGHDFVSEKSIGLLLALKPFLSSNKCEKIDAITQILKVVLLTDLLK